MVPDRLDGNDPDSRELRDLREPERFGSHGVACVARWTREASVDVADRVHRDVVAHLDHVLNHLEQLDLELR